MKITFEAAPQEMAEFIRKLIRQSTGKNDTVVHPAKAQHEWGETICSTERPNPNMRAYS